MHPVGKPMGLSLHDLQMTAEPAAYLTFRVRDSAPRCNSMTTQSQTLQESS
jgi:hypothetical protein